jgi:hypothetical protein
MAKQVKTIKEVAVKVLTDAKILMENQTKLDKEIVQLWNDYENNKTDIKSIKL